MHVQRLATRVSNACDRCRRQKQRCDPTRPCYNCSRANRECITSDPPSTSKDPPAKRPRLTSQPRPLPQEQQTLVDVSRETQEEPRNSWRSEKSFVSGFGSSESALDITKRVLQHRSPETRATFAIPGGDNSIRRSSIETTYSIADLIGVHLPSKAATDKLIDIYFYTVHWFSLVVHESTFRQRCNGIMISGQARSADRPFLYLVLMVLAMSCHYGREYQSEELSHLDLDELHTSYLKLVRASFMDLMDEDYLEFVQICVLLGSFWLYWGKPRSSFTILGAAIKSAQADSLHQQVSGRHLRGGRENIEERRRIWWTIYTWDRFATIVYGRPLSISDRDCDVPMPSVFHERLVDIHTSEAVYIELSPYQINLNLVYQIASPVLENVHNIRSHSRTAMPDFAQTVGKIDDSMQQSQLMLPQQLNLDRNPDLSVNASLQQRIHQLQALSLRLTYLNLKIIIHRPLLVDQYRPTRPSSTQGMIPNDDSIQQPNSSRSEPCFEAALAISRLGQSKANLVSVAGKTHLLSFLAMNIFTSSVILFICAMSDILSNAAQEAKRGMSRNLKMLKSIADVGSLSSQCSIIVGDLVQVILDKEKDEMFLDPLNARVSGDDTDDGGHPTLDHFTSGPRHPRVDTHSEQHASLRGATGKHGLDDPGFTFGNTMKKLNRGGLSEFQNFLF